MLRTRPTSPRRPLRQPTRLALRVELLEDRLPPGDAFLSWLLTLPVDGAAAAPAADLISSPAARRFTLPETAAADALRLVEPRQDLHSTTTTLVTVTTGADVLLVTPFAGDPLQKPDLTSESTTGPALRLSARETDRGDLGNLALPAAERAAESPGVASAPAATAANRLPAQAVLEGMTGAARRAQPAAVPANVGSREVQTDPASSGGSSQPAQDGCDFGPEITAPAGARSMVWEGTTICAMPGEWLARFGGVTGPAGDQTAAIRAQVQAAGLDVQVVRHLGMDGMFKFQVSQDLTYEQVRQVLQEVPGFRYVEPNGIATVARTPNDPRFGELYGMHNTGQGGGTVDADIDAPEAWDVTVGSTRTVVAVTDTGIDYNHPDLVRNLWINQLEIPATRMANLTDIDGDKLITFRDLNDPSNQGPFKISDQNGDGRITGLDILRPMNVDGGGADLGTGGWRNGRSEYGHTAYPDDLMGYRFTGAPTFDAFDDMGHGTHCAGTIGAEGNNNLGVAGVSWDVMMIPIKFLNAGGSGPWEDGVVAINYLTSLRQTYGIDIKLSSNSWGYQSAGNALRDAVAANGDAGMLFVVAAHNFSRNIDIAPVFPASYELPNILSVAATDNRDVKAGFSNWGLRTVHLGAPGVDTLSTVPTGGCAFCHPSGYNLLSGTSMATPHVAGAAALAWSISPGSTYEQVRTAILETVDPNFSLRVDGPTPVATGGRLNAQALMARMGFSVLSSTPADGEITAELPTTYVVNFSHPYDARTVQAADLEVNLIPADRVTLNSPTRATFEFDVSPIPGEGPQLMAIAQGAIMADPAVPLPNRELRSWIGIFRHDLVTLQVAATNPANASVVELPFTRLEVAFNEAIDAGSLGVNDLTLARGRVAAAELVDEVTAAYTLEGISGEGAFTFTMPRGAVADVYGNPMQTYSGNFSLDIGSILPFTTPLRPLRPSNSLVYQESITGIINSAEDQDGFVLRVDPGQTISVIGDPTAAALHLAVDLSVLVDGVPELLATATATGAGRDAVISGVATRDDLGGPQTYQMVVRNAGAAAGNFRLQVVLNAAIELEAHDGAANNTLETAQDISTSFRALPGASADRGAAFGTSDTANNFDYYRFSLEEGQTTTLGVRNLANTTLSLELLDAGGAVLATGQATPTGQVDRAIANFTAPATGTYYARTRGAAAVDYTLVVARDADLDWFMEPAGGVQALASRAVGGTQWVLGFTGRGGAGGGGLSLAIIDRETYGTPDANMVAAQNLGFTVTALPAATWFQADLSQYNVVVLPSRFSNTDVNRNLAVLTNYVRNGGVLVEHVIDNGASGNLLPGWQRMIVNPQTGADLTVTDAGSGLITGPGGTITNDNLDRGNWSHHGFILTSNFDLPAEVILHAGNDPRQAVTFQYELGAGKVLVSTIPTECYFPTGHACSSLNHPALYAVYLPNELAYAASLATPPGDWYSVSAVEGAALTLATSTPADQDGAYENNLDAVIELYDRDGAFVAYDDNSGADGRNALLNFVVPAGGAGAYYIRVVASDFTKQPTRGEYVLAVTNLAAAPGGAPGAGGGIQQLLLADVPARVAPVTTAQQAQPARTPSAPVQTVARVAAVPALEAVDRVFVTRDLDDDAWWRMAGF